MLLPTVLGYLSRSILKALSLSHIPKLAVIITVATLLLKLMPRFRTLFRHALQCSFAENRRASSRMVAFYVPTIPKNSKVSPGNFGHRVFPVT